MYIFLAFWIHALPCIKIYLMSFLLFLGIIVSCEYGVKRARERTFRTSRDYRSSMQWEKQLTGKSSCGRWCTDHMLYRKFARHHNSLSNHKACETGDESFVVCCIFLHFLDVLISWYGYSIIEPFFLHLQFCFVDFVNKLSCYYLKTG